MGHIIKMCDYGGGKEAKYQFKNGKHCCSKHSSMCDMVKIKISKANSNQSIERRNISSKTHKGKIPWNKGKTGVYTQEAIQKMSSARKGKTYKEIFGDKKAKKMISERMGIRLTINKIKEKYPFFSQIEAMRYNPNKLEEKEIQVHCRNHNCPNSKEKDGWFTPTQQQMKSRRDWLENEGKDVCSFYCSQDCKDECPIYHLKGTEPITNSHEDSIFRKEVLRRQSEQYGFNFCEICEATQKLHVHHEKPKKTHSTLALDPDNGIVLCEECHYKIGHKDECSVDILRKC